LWIVTYLLDNAPARTYLYDRRTKESKFLFINRKELEGLPLARMQPRVVKARDGMEMVCYLTLPLQDPSPPDATATTPPRPRPPPRPPGASRGFCLGMAVRGRATVGAITRFTSCWRTAGMPCSRSTTAVRQGSARTSSTPATRNGAAGCIATCSTPSSGRSM